MAKMTKRIEKELRRIAESVEEDYEDVKSEYDSFIAEKATPLTAVGQIKKKRRMALNRVSGFYNLYPLSITGPRQSEYEGEVHEYMDIFGLFKGPVEKGGEDELFFMSMSLKDEEGAKAEELEETEPFRFKGSIDQRYNRIYLARGTSFSKNEGAEGLDDVISQAIEALPGLEDLYETDDRGEMIWDGEKAVVQAYMMDLNEYNGGFNLLVHDIGADPVTVWPPRDTIPEDFNYKDDTPLLLYGGLRFKDGQLNINAYAVVPLNEE